MLELSSVTRTVQLPNGADLEILKGVDLVVEPGEHISIVGQSGTGKSTLLNIIGLLDLPDTGTYLLDEQDVARLGESDRAALRGRSFGFVFQQFNLFPNRDAVTNVEVPLLYGTGSTLLRRRALAADMLERVGLGNRLDAMPNQLSGGEQQRVAIARALVRKPRFILADEPTGALDLSTGKMVMDLLEEVAAETGAALIVISHDPQVAARAQRTHEISDGVLHEQTPAELAERRLG